MALAAYVRELHADSANKFDELREELESGKLTTVLAEDYLPVARVPHKIRILFQVGLRRTLELADSFARELEARSWVPLFVVSRAMLETAALLYDLWMRTREVLDRGDHNALVGYDEHAMNVLMGARVEEWGGPGFRALNVLTAIDRVAARNGLHDLRAYYDALSEHAHPNYMGMYGCYHVVEDNGTRGRFIDAPLQENLPAVSGPLNAAASALALVALAVEGYENVLPQFVAFCEEAVFRGGTWPEGVPYPRNAGG